MRIIDFLSKLRAAIREEKRIYLSGERAIALIIIGMVGGFLIARLLESIF